MSTEQKLNPEERRIAEILVERITDAVELLNLAAENAYDLTLTHGWEVNDAVMREAAAKASSEALGVVRVIAADDNWKNNKGGM